MILEKYEPKTSREISGNARKLSEIRDYLRRWKKGDALLVWGPAGTGKSLSVKLIAKEMGFEIFESHGIHERGRQGIEDLIMLSKQSGIFSKKKVIVVEDLEILESKTSLIKLLRESQHPVILIAENPYNLGIQPIIDACRSVRFEKVDRESMVKLLKKIATKEKIDMDAQTLNSIIINSEGDLRSALIDLEVASSLRERSENIYEIMKSLFRVGRLKNNDIDSSIIYWVSENIQREFRSTEEIANAHMYLAMTDLYLSRVARRQSWGLMKYVPDILGYGMKTSHKGRPSLLASYGPPLRVRRIGNSLAEKISSHVHTGKKYIHNYMPIIKNLSYNREFCNFLQLGEDEIKEIRSF